MSEPIDLLYVDCVKEEYPEYPRSRSCRASRRGIVLADNVSCGAAMTARATEPDPSPKAARGEALRKFNVRHSYRGPSLRSVVLPFGDGVGFAVRTG